MQVMQAFCWSRSIGYIQYINVLNFLKINETITKIRRQSIMYIVIINLSYFNEETSIPYGQSATHIYFNDMPVTTNRQFFADQYPKQYNLTYIWRV